MQLSGKPLLASNGYLGCRNVKHNGGLRYYADQEAVSLARRGSPAFGARSRGCVAVILDKGTWAYLMEIDGSQHNGSISLNLLFEELT